MKNPRHPTDPQSAQLRTQLNAVHSGLLTLHKVLLDHEKIRYERDFGRIQSPGHFLQLLLQDPFFAWLRTISGFITQIDEFLESKSPPDPREGHALLAQSRTLLNPSESTTPFQREYHRAFEESPEVAHAHTQWKLTLNQINPPSAPS